MSTIRLYMMRFFPFVLFFLSGLLAMGQDKGTVLGRVLEDTGKTARLKKAVHTVNHDMISFIRGVHSQAIHDKGRNTA